MTDRSGMRRKSFPGHMFAVLVSALSLCTGLLLLPATAVQAKQPEAPQLHEKGNLLKHIKVRKGEMNEGFARAARNIEGLDVLPSMGANVYDILKRDTLVLTKAGVEALEARLK